MKKPITRKVSILYLNWHVCWEWVSANRSIMVKLHFLAAFRSFNKHKSAFFINLIGLSTGLACTLLIFLWVQDERQVDGFHKDGDRIFRVMEHQRYANGDVLTTWSTPGILAAEMKREIPEIEYASTGSWEINHLISYNDTHFKETGLYADPDFFKIFSYPVVEGDPETMLNDNQAIIISERTAKKIFKDKSPLGELVKLDQDKSYKVTAVFADVPASSTVKFDYVLQAEAWRQEEGWLRSWGSNGPRTYVKLKDGASADALNAKLIDFIKKRNEGSVVDLFIFPYQKTYLHGSFENGKQTGGRIEYVRLFLIIAVFILIIACINFMNLSTAKASRKAREVGIRKAIGADKRSLIQQYLIESLLLSFFSVLLALMLIPVVLPYFNELTGKEIVLNFSWGFLLTLGIIIVFTGLLAGSYPALYLSSFQAVRVIKNDIKTSVGELWARKGLVVFQFVLSVFLIVAVVVVYKQIEFVQNKNLGYNKENMIRIVLDGKLSYDHETFFEELRKNPKIVNVAASGHSFTGRNNNSSGIEWPGKMEDEVVLFEMMRADYNLIPTMGVTMKEGRNFSRELATDSSAVVINETAARIMRLKEPVGSILTADTTYRIIGVVEDFHFQSLHEKVSPAIFWLSDNLWVAFIRLQSDQIQNTIGEIEEVYSRHNPGFTFDYTFVDEEYARMYQAEQRVASLSQYFAGFAVLISCLGLFGLAAFTAERRVKEIGIRKVLGASVFNLIVLLSKDFTKLVGMAILISLPLAYWATKDWLERFAFHINLSVWFFIGAGVLALVIALLTVSTQAYRAATLNPTDCLKDE